MVLLFVRHGESTANRDKIYAGHSEVPLTKKGGGQAKKTGESLSNNNITYILSSDLPRAYDTAQIIRDSLGLEIKIHTTVLLREVDPGEFTGKPHQSGKSIYHIALNSLNGESNKDLSNRAKKAIQLIRDIETAGDILIVGHNSFCSIIWAVLEGARDFKKYRDTWHMENASIKSYNLF